MKKLWGLFSKFDSTKEIINRIKASTYDEAVEYFSKKKQLLKEQFDKLYIVIKIKDKHEQ